MDLYALPPEEFTAARDAAAKQDKALKALRKPTVSAWVVNTLVRRDAALLDQLLDLGQELGHAQHSGDAAAMRTLGEQRRQLVGAVARRAVELAGRDIAAPARLEVEATLEAALADPPSAEAVRSGQLVRALSFAGFGGVDLDGAVAQLPAPKPKAAKPAAGGKPAGRTAERTAKLERAALQAQGALDDAVRRAQAAAQALETTQTELTAAKAAGHEAADAVTQAQQALEQAQARASDAQHRRTGAKKAHEEATRKAERATRAVAEAQAAAEQARKALDAARRG